MREKTHDRTTLDYVKPGAEERARLREDFDYNDLNKDGRLTMGEFIRFMRNVDEDLTADYRCAQWSSIFSERQHIPGACRVPFSL